MECCKLKSPILTRVTPMCNRGQSQAQLMPQGFLLTPCKVELLLSPCIHVVFPSLALPQGKIPESAVCDQGILPLYKQNGELLNALMAAVPHPASIFQLSGGLNIAL